MPDPEGPMPLPMPPNTPGVVLYGVVPVVVPVPVPVPVLVDGVPVVGVVPIVGVVVTGANQYSVTCGVSNVLIAKKTKNTTANWHTRVWVGSEGKIIIPWCTCC